VCECGTLVRKQETPSESEKIPEHPFSRAKVVISCRRHSEEEAAFFPYIHMLSQPLPGL